MKKLNDGICEMCGNYVAIRQKAHIAAEGKKSGNNLLMLCPSCHIMFDTSIKPKIFRALKDLEVKNLPKSWETSIYEQAAVASRAVKSVKIEEPVILIRINRLYREDLSDEELYDATRGVWKVGKRRESASYAFAVYREIVREVYFIEKWYPAGTTEYHSRIQENPNIPGRWEFEGRVAESTIRMKYINRSVSNYFTRNSQNPILYVNC